MDFFNGDKSPYFGGGVKPSVPCLKVLRHVKKPNRYGKRYLIGKIHGHFSPSSSQLRYKVSAARELWWMNHE
jgi:hypothetical protein